VLCSALFALQSQTFQYQITEILSEVPIDMDLIVRELEIVKDGKFGFSTNEVL
jgi:hypothetical protein